MAKYTFGSPGQMIAAGAGLVLLSIVLLEFSLLFFGGFFGVWWIIRGIMWHNELSASQPAVDQIDSSKYWMQQTVDQVREMIDNGNHNAAINLLVKSANDPRTPLNYQGRKLFLEQAASLEKVINVEASN